MDYDYGKLIVPDEGRPSARIVLVGEAPGPRETASRRPFVGPSGRRLTEWWEPVGLSRRDIYITNALPYQPANIHEVPRAEFAHWTERLHERIAALGDGPVVLVPVGNYALYALTGLGRVSFHHRDGKLPRPGITSLRGSILAARIAGRDYKVIPSIHPAATFARGGKNRKRSAQWTRACIADWQRIAADAAFRELRLPKRDHYIRPTLADVRDFLHDAARARLIALDIETPRVREVEQLGVYKSGPRKGQPKTRITYSYPAITCIGFSIDPSWSITVPLTLEYWGSEAALDEARGLVASILALPAEKVIQNGLFDTYWLRSEGYPVVNWVWDTRAMHHALDPTSLHSLEYLASIYTREPYWKDEAKDPDSATRYAQTGDAAFWVYCGKDVATTLEIQHRLHERLVARGRLAFYQAAYGELLPVLLDMSLHGMRVDHEERARQLARLALERAEVEKSMEYAAGRSLLGKTSVSGDKLAKLLYRDLGLPKQYTKDAKTGGRRVTTGETALVKLRARYGTRPVEGGTTVDDVCGTVLAHRGVAKDSEFMGADRVDDDGRMRALYSPFTDSGRLNAQAPPRGNGCNPQAITRGPTRRIYRPDEG